METNHVGFTMLTYFSSHLVITIRLEIMVVSKNCVITQYNFFSTEEKVGRKGVRGLFCTPNWGFEVQFT